MGGEAVISIRKTLELGVTGSHQNAAAGHRAMTPRSAVPTARTIKNVGTARSRREPKQLSLMPAARFATPTFVFDESR